MEPDSLCVQLKLHFDHHPKHGTVDSNDLELALWKELAEAGVLFAPGQMFAADVAVPYLPGRLSSAVVGSATETTAMQETEDGGHFRISFSNAEVSSGLCFTQLRSHMDQSS
jgi:aromatic amino acid aminotransferase I